LNRRGLRLKREDNAKIENSTLSSKALQLLRIMIEKLMLEATEELDPMISLMQERPLSV
jgi:hypothetical protein